MFNFSITFPGTFFFRRNRASGTVLVHSIVLISEVTRMSRSNRLRDGLKSGLD
jgi:hypothetical protein